jgi:curved DNA-binding protein CbpA
VNAVPTPYQIFNQKKGAKYSKQTFYELVKLYHPDRHDHSKLADGLSYATKLERYRLVVAANDILSNPVRRGAYDRYGAGWNGQPDVVTPQDAAESSTPWRGRGWNGGPEGPSQNATWEDWERWYQRDNEGPQSPRFVSNTAFVFLIIMFAVIGGVGQATRVGNYSMNFLDQRDALHSDISQDLMRRRKETINGFGGRDERIQSFLKQRAPVTYTLSEESYKKLLPAPKTPSSQDRGLKHRHGDNLPPKGNEASAPKGG